MSDQEVSVKQDQKCWSFDKTTVVIRHKNGYEIPLEGMKSSAGMLDMIFKSFKKHGLQMSV